METWDFCPMRYARSSACMCVVNDRRILSGSTSQFVDACRSTQTYLEQHAGAPVQLAKDDDQQLGLQRRGSRERDALARGRQGQEGAAVGWVPLEDGECTCKKFGGEETIQW